MKKFLFKIIVLTNSLFIAHYSFSQTPEIEWQNTIGGTGNDILHVMIATTDGGYIAGGASASLISGDKTENSRGLDDIWIVKTDSTGNKIWDKTIGGSGIDRLSMIREISNGDFIVGGTSNSPKSGDKTSKTIGNTGFNDYWIMRLGPPEPPTATAAEEESSETSDVTVASQSAATDDLVKLTLQANPNPTKGIVNLNYSGGQVNKKIQLNIYDNSGKLIMHNMLSSGKGSYATDLTKQPAGMYYITISSGTASATRIVIKD